MAYHANRSGQNADSERAAKDQRNAEVVKQAADVAQKSANPYAKAAGTAVKVGDKVTGGAVSNKLGKTLRNTPAEKVMDIAKPAGGKKDPKLTEMFQRNAMRKATNKNQNLNEDEKDLGGEQQSSPSSDSEKDSEKGKKGGKKSSSPGSSLGPPSRKDSSSSNSEGDAEVKAKKRMKIIIAISGIAGALFFAIIGIVIIVSVLGLLTNFDDALGVSSNTGRNNGELAYGTSSKEAQAFYDRINDVELEFLAKGQQVDALKIVAVYHVLKENKAKIDYDDMTEARISEIASAMLNGGVYDEETFKSNLINDIFPEYLPRSTNEERKNMANDVLQYVNDYYDFINEEPPNTYSDYGASTGTFTSWKQTGAPWSGVKMGNSGRTIGQIGCLVTSIAMLIAKSGVQTTIANFNPGTFVQFLNNNGGFDGYGNLQYAPISKAAPSFRWVNQIDLTGMSKDQKLNTIKNYASQGYYMAAEVSTNGQHWVAIDSVNGNSIRIMDPATNITDLWASGKYTPASTKTLNLFKVG